MSFKKKILGILRKHPVFMHHEDFISHQIIFQKNIDKNCSFSIFH